MYKVNEYVNMGYPTATARELKSNIYDNGNEAGTVLETEDLGTALGALENFPGSYYETEDGESVLEVYAVEKWERVSSDRFMTIDKLIERIAESRIMAEI